VVSSSEPWVAWAQDTIATSFDWHSRVGSGSGMQRGLGPENHRDWHGHVVSGSGTRRGGSASVLRLTLGKGRKWSRLGRLRCGSGTQRGEPRDEGEFGNGGDDVAWFGRGM